MNTPNDTEISPIAASIIAKCGGVKNVAHLCGCSVSWVYKWTYPKSKSGRGGVVPHQDAVKLLEAAKLGKVSLKPEDFFEVANV